MAREPVYVSSVPRTVRGAVTEPKPLAAAHARRIPALAAKVTGDALKRSGGDNEQSGGQGSPQTMAANDVIWRRVGGERLASCPRYLLSSYALLRGFYRCHSFLLSVGPRGGLGQPVLPGLCYEGPPLHLWWVIMMGEMYFARLYMCTSIQEGQRGGTVPVHTSMHAHALASSVALFTDDVRRGSQRPPTPPRPYPPLSLVHTNARTLRIRARLSIHNKHAFIALAQPTEHSASV